MLKFQEIFAPGGFPRHTYNPRVDLNLEARLAEVKDNLSVLADFNFDIPISAEVRHPLNSFPPTARTPLSTLAPLWSV